MRMDPFLWRELCRQRKSKIAPVIQLIAYSCLFIYLADYLAIEIVSLLIPLIYLTAVCADVFNFDFANHIESLLSLPVDIKDIIRGKCIFALAKAYLLSLATVVILLLYYIIMEELPLRFSAEAILLSVILPVWQYFYSCLIGLLIWNVGIKSRAVPFIFQMIVFAVCILLLLKNMTGILSIILLVALFPVLAAIKRLSKSLNKEKIIIRSI